MYGNMNNTQLYHIMVISRVLQIIMIPNYINKIHNPILIRISSIFITEKLQNII